MEPILDAPDSWLLVPALAELKEPAYSFELNDLPLYPPEVIADAILSAPGVRLAQPAQPSWKDWKARWEEKGRYIEIAINALEAESENGKILAWESSSIRLHCRPSELLAVWEVIRSKCPGVWLDDEHSRLWSPRSFAERFSA
jgi:hypothetical protein